MKGRQKMRGGNGGRGKIKEPQETEEREKEMIGIDRNKDGKGGEKES